MLLSQLIFICGFISIYSNSCNSFSNKIFVLFFIFIFISISFFFCAQLRVVIARSFRYGATPMPLNLLLFFFITQFSHCLLSELPGIQIGH